MAKTGDTKGILKSLFGWGKSSPLPKSFNLDEVVGLGQGLGSIESSYWERMRLPYSREEMYRLYDELDELSEISGVLWAYAEDATQRNIANERPLWVTSKNKEVVKILDELFYTTLDLDDWILACARDLGKYGDQFPKLNLKNDEGIIGISDWPYPQRVKRLENKEGVLLGFLDEQTIKDTGNVNKDNLSKVILKPWEMVHFRIRSHNRMPRNEERWIYGTSLLFPVRRSGRRVLLYSDLLFLYRLRNSFDRRVYYVDVGSESMEQVIRILKKWRRAIESNQYTNWSESILRVTNNPLSLGEQIFWPKRPESQSTIDTVPGNANVADMADVDREENAMFAGLRAPKEYFGFGSEGGMFDRDKSLALKDMRWGRAVYSLNRALKVGFHRMGSIHLSYRKIDPRDPKNQFQVHMVSPSVLELLQNLQAKSDIAQTAENYYRVGETFDLNMEPWREYVMSEFMGFSKSQITLFTKGSEPEPGGPGGNDPDDDKGDEGGDEGKPSPKKTKKVKGPMAKGSIFSGEDEEDQETLVELEVKKDTRNALPEKAANGSIENHAPLVEWLNSSDSDAFVESLQPVEESDEESETEDGPGKASD